MKYQIDQLNYYLGDAKGATEHKPKIQVRSGQEQTATNWLELNDETLGGLSAWLSSESQGFFISLNGQPLQFRPCFLETESDDDKGMIVQCPLKDADRIGLYRAEVQEDGSTLYWHLQDWAITPETTAVYHALEVLSQKAPSFII